MRLVLATGAFRGAINGASETVVTYATHLHRSGVAVGAAAPVDVERPLVAGGVAALRLRRMSPVLGRRATAAATSPTKVRCRHW